MKQNIFTSEDYIDFCKNAREIRAKYPEYREGVVLYNALAITHFDLANELHELSPFHSDDKIPAFLDAIADRMLQTV